MTVLAADRNTARREGDFYEFPVLATAKIFGGGMVGVDANGWAQSAADIAGLKLVGLAEAYVDNSGGANGAKMVKVRRGVFKLAANGLTDADIGKPVFVVDDQTVQLAATANDVHAGILVQVESATEAWVALPIRVGAALADSVAADVATVVADLNALLALLRAAKLIAT